MRVVISDTAKAEVARQIAYIRERNPDAALAYELATAVRNIAREQMELEQRINHAAQRSKGFEPRGSALELWLGDDQAISEAQAIDLALAVKAIADALEQHSTDYAYL